MPKSNQTLFAPVLLLCALGGLAWAFIALSAFAQGDASGFDGAILLGMREPLDLSDPVGPKWFEEMMRDFSALGGAGVLTLVALSAAGYLWLSGRTRSVGLLLIAVVGATVTSQLLKGFFDRPRPDLVPHGSYVINASFPSGHSLMAAAVYLTLGLLIAKTSERRAVRVFIMLVAVLIAVLVGASRIYLGVHWPTDVLAGWAVGTGFALFCAAFAKAPVR